MKKLINFLDNWEENIITVLLPLMVIVVFLATFFRFVKLPVMPWGEELARYLMVWIVFLGLGTGAKKNAHFFVQILINAMPEFTHRYINIFRTAVVTAFCFIIILLSIQVIQAQIMMGQISPSLRIPMWIAYLAIPVGCATMIIRSIQYLVKDLTGKTE